ncbi:MAG: peptidoglycan/xylan/chitin deacetylase (PgdA/CDA1 family) [Bacteriovoracaceae bacterium]|jgi:peptidoglycan/xylan/chitin deacetylase (PgdA/CDA1 family)
MEKALYLAIGLIISFESFACSAHFNHLLDLEKQFPDINIDYNSSHRGWSKYLSKSLHGTRKLALTFDDGPHPVNTPRLLDILKKHNVKATFFTMGALIKEYPSIAKRIVSEGHILAGHDWVHINSNTEPEEVFGSGLKKTVLSIKEHNSNREFYYRFPYGAYGNGRGGYHHLNTMKKVSHDLFGENCINFAFWDIDTSDWVSNMTSDNIVQTLMANLNGGEAYKFKKISNGYTKERYTIRRPLAGGVVLMHDIHKRTIDATEKFLEKIKGSNIEIVPLDQVREFEFGNAVCELLKGF